MALIKVSLFGLLILFGNIDAAEDDGQADCSKNVCVSGTAMREELSANENFLQITGTGENATIRLPHGIPPDAKRFIHFYTRTHEDPTLRAMTGQLNNISDMLEGYRKTPDRIETRMMNMLFQQSDLTDQSPREDVVPMGFSGTIEFKNPPPNVSEFDVVMTMAPDSASIIPDVTMIIHIKRDDEESSTGETSTMSESGPETTPSPDSETTSQPEAQTESSTVSGSKHEMTAQERVECEKYFCIVGKLIRTTLETHPNNLVEVTGEGADATLILPHGLPFEIKKYVYLYLRGPDGVLRNYQGTYGNIGMQLLAARNHPVMIETQVLNMLFQQSDPYDETPRKDKVPMEISGVFAFDRAPRFSDNFEFLISIRENRTFPKPDLLMILKVVSENTSHETTSETETESANVTMSGAETAGRNESTLETETGDGDKSTSGTETGDGNESTSGTETGDGNESTTGTEADSGNESTSGTETEGETGSTAATETEDGSESTSGTETEGGTGSTAATETEDGSESTSGTETEGETGSTAATETEDGSESTSGTETEGGNESTSGTETEGETGSTAATETEDGSESTSGTETGDGNESITRTGAERGNESTSGTETEGETGSTAATETEDGSESTSGTETEGGNESTSGTETEGETGSTAATETEDGSESTSGTETGDGNESITRTGAERGNESTSGTETEGETGSTAATETEDGSESTSGTETESGNESTSGTETEGETGSTAATETEDGSESTSGTETGDGNESITRTGAERGNESTSGTETEGETGSTAATETEDGSESTSGTETEGETGSTSATETEGGSESTSGTETESGNESTSGTETEGETGSTAATETKDGSESTSGTRIGSGTVTGSKYEMTAQQRVECEKYFCIVGKLIRTTLETHPNNLVEVTGEGADATLILPHGLPFEIKKYVYLYLRGPDGVLRNYQGTYGNIGMQLLAARNHPVMIKTQVLNMLFQQSDPYDETPRKDKVPMEISGVFAFDRAPRFSDNFEFLISIRENRTFPKPDLLMILKVVSENTSHETTSETETESANVTMSGAETAGRNESTSETETGDGDESTSGTETGDGNESTSGTETGDGNESTTGTEADSGNESTSGTDTGDGNESTTGTEADSGNESTSGTDTGDGNESTTGTDTGDGNESTTGTEAESGNESTSGTDTGDGNESTSGTDTGDGNESTTGTEAESGNESTSGTDTGDGNESTSGTETESGNESASGTETEGGTGFTAATETEYRSESTSGTETEGGTGSTAATETGDRSESTSGTETESGNESTSGTETVGGDESTSGNQTEGLPYPEPSPDQVGKIPCHYYNWLRTFGWSNPNISNYYDWLLTNGCLVGWNYKIVPVNLPTTPAPAPQPGLLPVHAAMQDKEPRNPNCNYYQWLRKSASANPTVREYYNWLLKEKCIAGISYAVTGLGSGWNNTKDAQDPSESRIYQGTNPRCHYFNWLRNFGWSNPTDTDYYGWLMQNHCLVGGNYQLIPVNLPTTPAPEPQPRLVPVPGVIQAIAPVGQNCQYFAWIKQFGSSNPTVEDYYKWLVDNNCIAGAEYASLGVSSDQKASEIREKYADVTARPVSPPVPVPAHIGDKSPANPDCDYMSWLRKFGNSNPTTSAYYDWQVANGCIPGASYAFGGMKSGGQSDGNSANGAGEGSTST